MKTMRFDVEGHDVVVMLFNRRDEEDQRARRVFHRMVGRNKTIPALLIDNNKMYEEDRRIMEHILDRLYSAS